MKKKHIFSFLGVADKETEYEEGDGHKHSGEHHEDGGEKKDEVVKN